MAENQEYVDINALELGDDSIEGFDLEADTFAPPPPPDDGEYVVRLRFASPDVDKHWIKRYIKGFDVEGSSLSERNDSRNYYFQTRLIGVVADESSKFNGRMVFDGFVGTNARGGATRVGGILKALGIVPTDGHIRQAQQLSQALASEPLVRITTQWRARNYDKGSGTTTLELRGQRKFPQNADGSYQHMVKDPTTGDIVAAQAEINLYTSLTGE